MAKILIIDDDSALSDIFKDVLEQAKHEVLVADNGTKGFEAAKVQIPNLILLDFMLPDENGAAVLKKLKAEEQTKEIPVVILSNFGQEDNIKQTLYDGASEFWLKYQLGPSDIVSKVKAILHEQPKVS